MKQEMIGWQWHQLDHMQIICTSLQTDNHASTLPLSFFRPDALPAAQPTASNHWIRDVMWELTCTVYKYSEYLSNVCAVTILSYPTLYCILCPYVSTSITHQYFIELVEHNAVDTARWTKDCSVLCQILHQNPVESLLTGMPNTWARKKLLFLINNWPCVGNWIVFPSLFGMGEEVLQQWYTEWVLVCAKLLAPTLYNHLNFCQ